MNLQSFFLASFAAMSEGLRLKKDGQHL